MDLEQRLRDDLAAPDPGANFTDAVMTRARQVLALQSLVVRTAGGRTVRIRNRFIWIGTLTALAVAAAILAFVKPESSPAVVTDVPHSVPAVSSAAPIVAAAATEPRAAAPATRVNVASGFTVAVLPVRHESQNVSGRRLVEAFHSALLEELRKVPGLTLAMQDTADPAIARYADYLLTVASVAETVLPSGETMSRSADGQSVAGAARGSPVALQAELIVQPTAGQPRPRAYNAMFPLGDMDSADLRRFCEQMPGPFHDLNCITAKERAAQQVEVLRSRVFPVDAAWQRGQVARLRDASRNDRDDALYALLTMRERGLPLDAAAIDPVVAYIATMPAELRTEALRRLSVATDVGFVPPLLDVLRGHPDMKVRLDVLVALATNAGSDPRVRTTLSAMMQDDSPLILRMAAGRTLTGEAEWNRYVVATLQDPDLPLATRLEPLQISTQWTAPAEAAGMAPLVNDRQVVAVLVGMAREGLRAPAQVATTRQVLDLLKAVEDPAVYELFLQLARDRNSPSPFAQAAWMVRHKDDPAVSKILEENATRRGIPRDLFQTQPR